LGFAASRADQPELKGHQMDTRPPSAPPTNSTNTRRRRRNSDGDGASVRYFLPKPGSSPASPELGAEVASEGEALIQAFKNGQTFYTVAAWKAVPEVNGGGSPVIVKQPLEARTVQS
jgi:hypothetical protein